MSSSTQSIEKLPSKTFDYPLCPMRKKYDGERSTIVASVPDWGNIQQHSKKNKHGDGVQKVNVLYMCPKRAAQYEVTYNNKLHQWERNGGILPEGNYEFVISRYWRMLAFSSADEENFNSVAKIQKVSKVYFKHSTLTSGRKVLFAGTYMMQEGTWDDQSGHYRPQNVHVAACKAWHAKNGIEDSVYKEHAKTTLGKRKSPSSEELILIK